MTAHKNVSAKDGNGDRAATVASRPARHRKPARTAAAENGAEAGRIGEMLREIKSDTARLLASANILVKQLAS